MIMQKIKLLMCSALIAAQAALAGAADVAGAVAPSPEKNELQLFTARLEQLHQLRESLARARSERARVRQGVSQQESLMRVELASLRERLEGLSQWEEERLLLEEEWRERKELARRGLAAWRRELERLEEMALAWTGRLPPPLRDMTKDFSRAGNRSEEDRLKDLTGFYSRLQQAQHGINPARMILTGADGEQREAEVLFVGFAQGYAVSRQGDGGWLGRPVDDGWRWQVEKGLGPAIRQALAIHGRRGRAQTVALPMRLDLADLDLDQP